MYLISPELTFAEIMRKNKPIAVAQLIGNDDYPTLNGSVKFFDTPYNGILITAEVFGLTKSTSDFYAMHIHEFGDCTIPFDQTGNHYNPENRPHPEHAGDLVPLLSNQGYAYLSFYDNRFSISEILGKSVIIHENADDFTSQPSGNAGNKIACGVIQPVAR